MSRTIDSRVGVRDLGGEISKIPRRGNPICYYPEGVLTHLLVQGVRSSGFVLPVGKYTLGWVSGFHQQGVDRKSILPQVHMLPKFSNSYVICSLL